jgi:hypothetical protein
MKVVVPCLTASCISTSSGAPCHCRRAALFPATPSARQSRHSVTSHKSKAGTPETHAIPCATRAESSVPYLQYSPF